MRGYSWRSSFRSTSTVSVSGYRCCCYLGMVRPRASNPLSLRCRSSLSKVRRISLSTAVSGSSRGLRYDRSSRPESSELGDMVEATGGSLGTGGWISLQKK